MQSTDLLTNGAEWTFEDIKLRGVSLSGIRTAISYPELGFCFDVAQGFPFLINLKQYFISHGHLDHAAGIPYIISQKAMHHHEAPKFYMPPSLVAPMTQIMKTWESIEKHEYKLEFVGLEPDQEVHVKGDYFMRAFPSCHRIDSLGYTLFKRKKKLKQSLKNESQANIQKLKANGVDVQETHDTPILSFSGDSTIEFLNQRPWIRDSRVILMESTYLDDRKSIEHARTWGHTHLDEILPMIPKLNCQKLVLIHMSSRYSTREAKEILDKRIPITERHRVDFFPGR